MANPKGTVVCDKNRCVISNMKPANGKTAHERLAEKAEIPTKDVLVAGSIKGNGDVVAKSESINYQNTGKCDLGQAGVDYINEKPLEKVDGRGRPKNKN